MLPLSFGLRRFSAAFFFRISVRKKKESGVKAPQSKNDVRRAG